MARGWRRRGWLDWRSTVVAVLLVCMRLAAQDGQVTVSGRLVLLGPARDLAGASVSLKSLVDRTTPTPDVKTTAAADGSFRMQIDP